MHPRRLGELRLPEQVADPVVDDEVVRALLVDVEDAHDPAEQLLLQTELGRLVPAPRLVARLSRDGFVEPRRKAREHGLRRLLGRRDHLLSEQVAL